MAFEERAARMLAELEEEERRRLEDSERRKADALAEQTQKKEALEQDPRFQQIKDVAYSPALREALDAYSLEAGSNYGDVKTQVNAKGLLQRLRGRQVTSEITKVPGYIDIKYVEAPNDKPNRPVGTFIVKSLLDYGIDSDSDAPGQGSTPDKYVELEITWREKPETRKLHEWEDSVRSPKKGYLGINANPGMGIMFLEWRLNDKEMEDSQTVYYDLDSVIDEIARRLAEHRLRKSK